MIKPAATEHQPLQEQTQSRDAAFLAILDEAMKESAVYAQLAYLGALARQSDGEDVSEILSTTTTNINMIRR